MNIQLQVPILFIFSGFSALIYQVVWQRTLFATFGSNDESVIVIVSVFMFGLGVGALVGGVLQKKYPQFLLQIFLSLEIAIGLYGMVSMDIIELGGRISSNESPFFLVLIIYSILAIPTMLMGATLPVLVSLLERVIGSIGKTVGILYSLNTYGSAIAAFGTVYILFYFLGKQSTIYVAAVSNFATALLIYMCCRQHAFKNTISQIQFEEEKEKKNETISFKLMVFIVGSLGFISLSQEIVWIRLVGFMTGSDPKVFGTVVGFFLIGIAQGSLKSTKINKNESYTFILRSLMLGALFFILTIPISTYATLWFSKDTGVHFAYIAVILSAYFFGSILPLVIDIGCRTREANTQTVSHLYFANIIGSTLGPLLTGFILFDFFELDEVFNLIFLCSIILIIIIFKKFPVKKKSYYTPIIFLIIIFIFFPFLNKNYLEKILFPKELNLNFKDQVHNRSGILVVKKGDPSDKLIGSGSYDGQYNIDLQINSNGIDRAYIIPSLTNRLEKVLSIGLATGSWDKVLTSHDGLKSLQVVEINPGYAQLITNYPEIRSLLENPNVNITVDDARRWLRNHPNEKFDFILMNTTQHWRSNVTNILSVEFISLCKKHLSINGVLYLNTTGSKDVEYTVAHVFKHVVKFGTFVAASDSPFNMTNDQKIENFRKFRDRDGRSLYDKNEYQSKFQELANLELIDIGDELRTNKKLIVITDDNMATEFKRRH